jgi:CheY-like chemotaxis protein
MSSPSQSRASSPILLIEDEPSVTAFLRAALERRGYAVVDASSGAEGLEKLDGGEYFGVISDIRKRR